MWTSRGSRTPGPDLRPSRSVTIRTPPLPGTAPHCHLQHQHWRPHWPPLGHDRSEVGLRSQGHTRSPRRKSQLPEITVTKGHCPWSHEFAVSRSPWSSSQTHLNAPRSSREAPLFTRNPRVSHVRLSAALVALAAVGRDWPPPPPPPLPPPATPSNRCSLRWDGVRRRAAGDKIGSDERARCPPVPCVSFVRRDCVLGRRTLPGVVLMTRPDRPQGARAARRRAVQTSSGLRGTR